MAREVETAGTPDEWLRRARSNLARARQAKLPEVLWEDLCMDAQQAAEKAIKAVFRSGEIAFPRTHNITELLVLLSQAGREVSAEVWEAGRLTNYAILSRYPGCPEPVTEAEYRCALALAETVVRWAEGILASSRKPS